MTRVYKKEKDKKKIKEILRQASEKPIITDEVRKEMNLLEFSGLENLNNLDPLNLAKFERICGKYAEKIETMLDNLTIIKVHIKAMHKGGKQRKYEMKINTLSPTRIFTGKAIDWDIERVTHKCFKDIEKQITHHFKTDTSYKKDYA